MTTVPTTRHTESPGTPVSHADRPGPVRSGPVPALRRTWSLARAELTLLRRNKLLLFNAAAMPLLPLVLLLPLHDAGTLGAEAITRGVGSMIGFLLLFVVYYNLLSSYVARRDELVLKRLRTGECSDTEILAGTAVPALLVGILQTAVLVGAGMWLLDLPAPANAAVLAWAVVGGAVLFAALALVTTPFTKNSEAAQITCLPLVMVAIAGAGLIVPIPAMPQPWQPVAELTPMAPSAELVQLGWLGRTLEGAPVSGLEALAAAGPPTLVLLGWTLLSVVAVRAWFRWEPRS